MTKTKRDSDPDYKVGYGRPPVEYQFKPGQRANPGGRPRGSQNLTTVVRRVLNKKIPVRKGDKTQKVSLFEAISETQALKAAQGDRHSAAVMINLATKAGLFGVDIPPSIAATSAHANPYRRVCPSHVPNHREKGISLRPQKESSPTRFSGNPL